MSALKKRLDIVWQHAGPSPRWRYIPRSLDGGAGWGVFDRKAGRFLMDREVKATPLDDLLEQFTN